MRISLGLYRYLSRRATEEKQKNNVEALRLYNAVIRVPPLSSLLDRPMLGQYAFLVRFVLSYVSLDPLHAETSGKSVLHQKELV